MALLSSCSWFSIAVGLGKVVVHGSTRALKPAALSAFTSAAASKSPVTSKVVALGLAVSPVTPSTVAIAPLIASQQGPQQLWMPETFRVLTLPWGMPLTAFIASR